MANISLIYACARNGVIGKQGQMPWHIPEDLAHFKRTTLGAPVIMGRKTWDSLPERFRPLPGRLNVVVTRQVGWQAEGAHMAHSLEQAIQACSGTPEVWIMGGAQIYAQALPLAQRVVVTEIDAEFEGDAYAPTLDPSQWQAITRSTATSSSGYTIHFVDYRRIS